MNAFLSRIIIEVAVFVLMLIAILFYRGESFKYQGKYQECSNATKQFKVYADSENQKNKEIESLKNSLFNTKKQDIKKIEVPNNADCDRSFKWMVSQAKEMSYE